MSIRIKEIKKTFRNFKVLENVSVDVAPGEFLALLGPSGSGKTTLLRIIAGLEIADAGEVFLEGERTIEKPPSERNVGFVFQHYALFRNMTVFENIAFGLKVKPRALRPTKGEIRNRVMELLKLVHLQGLEWHYPRQLSGGQRQRVALARVLAIEPKVMLLDEPFGSLDSKVRKELRRWLRRLHDEMHITTILVTHDQEEAMEIADRVAIMNEGKIEQIGSPEEIWNRPANAFVYDFMGNYNIFPALIDEKRELHLLDDESIQKMELILPPVSEREEGFWRGMLTHVNSLLHPKVKEPENREPGIVPPPATYLKLFVRPFEITLSRTRKPGVESISAKVVNVNPAGPLTKVELERANGLLIQAEIPKEAFGTTNFQKGETLWVSPTRYRIFEGEAKKGEFSNWEGSPELG